MCDDKFGNIDASVACKSMGNIGGELITSADTPDGTGQIWIDQLNCSGTETSILDCPMNLRKSTCQHTDDIGITCILCNNNVIKSKVRVIDGNGTIVAGEGTSDTIVSVDGECAGMTTKVTGRLELF